MPRSAILSFLNLIVQVTLPDLKRKEDELKFSLLRYLYPSLLFLMILISPLDAIAQQHKKLDSLTRKIAGSSTVELKALFVGIGEELKRLPFDDRVKQSEAILYLTKDQGGSLSRVYAYNELSDTYADVDNVMALQYAQEGLSFARTKDSVSLSVALMELGRLFAYKALYPEAVKFFLELTEVAKGLNDIDLLLESSKEIIIIYYKAGNHEEVIKKGREFMPLFEKSQPAALQPAISTWSRGIINAYNTMGLSYYLTERYDSSIKYFDHALEHAQRTKDEEWIGLMNGNRALSYLKLGKRAEALHDILIDLAISKRYGIWSSARNCSVFLCEIHLEEKKVSTAAQYLDSVIYFNRKANEELPPSYWRILSAVEAAKGNYKSAYEAHAEYAEKNLDVIRNQQTEQVARIKSAYDLSQSQKEVDILTHDNLVKESQIAFQRTRFIATAIVLILLLILTIHFVRNSKRQKRNALLITQQRDEIAKKSAELEFQNNEINSQNEELFQHQEEIASQRDVLESQNIQLQKVQEIIEKQRKDIQSENERLEIEVRSRTQELMRSNKELIEHNNQLEQFAFITAHNLRSPVARILGLGNLLEFSLDEADAKAISQNIVSSTRELDAIVTDLGKILEVKGDNSLVRQEVDLSSILERTYKGLEKELIDTGAQIKGDFSEVGKIRSVASYVESIIYNLVSNAIKYRDPDRSPVIELRSFSDEKYYCLVVIDNGLGMDLEKHGDNIFKLYKRFHFHVEGKGLGLYLIKTQITALGGRIDVKSEPGKGTTFFVYFKK